MPLPSRSVANIATNAASASGAGVPSIPECTSECSASTLTTRLIKPRRLTLSRTHWAAAVHSSGGNWSVSGQVLAYVHCPDSCRACLGISRPDCHGWERERRQRQSQGRSRQPCRADEVRSPRVTSRRMAGSLESRISAATPSDQIAPDRFVASANRGAQRRAVPLRRAISFPSSHSSSNPTAASKPKPHCAKVSSFVPSSLFKKSAWVIR